MANAKPITTKPSKVAVVTGGNKGIGYAIVKGLCEKLNGTVYLTARNEDRGRTAINNLKDLDLNPHFHHVDITDEKTLINFKARLKEASTGIDILINNAGVAYPEESWVPYIDQARNTINVNYFGTLRVCEKLFPLLNHHARVVHLSSSAGHLSRIPSAELRDQFKDPNLTVEQLSNLMNQYLIDVVENKHIEKGWGNSPYVVSKVGVSALTIIQQKHFDTEPEMRDITVNSVHPGYVLTDMNKKKGIVSPEKGARAPLFLAMENHPYRGQYIWSNSVLADWTADSIPGYIADDD